MTNVAGPGPEETGSVETESTRAEKLLAVGLVVFLLLGGFWILDRLGSAPRPPDYGAIAAAEDLESLDAAYQAALADRDRAVEAAAEARAAAEKARSEYEFRREEYRVALDRGHDDPSLARAHEAAKVVYEEAQAKFELADAARARLEVRKAAPEAAFLEANRRVSEAYDRAQGRHQLVVFGLRFGYALPLFALAVWGWLALRRRHSRHLILATAFIGFAGLQALGLVGQYGWYLLRGVSMIALSLAGSVICVAGLVALRRWASNAHRVALVRLRRNQCPGCGFPLVAGTAFCAGCGRRLTEACPRCGGEIVTQSPFCRNCGWARG